MAVISSKQPTDRRRENGARPVALEEEHASLADLPRDYQAAPVIQQGPTSRAPGLTARSKRVREWQYLKRIELAEEARREGHELAPQELAQAAEKAWEAFRAGQGSGAVLKQFEATAPTSEAPQRSEINREVEIAACLSHPTLRWLSQLMLGKTNARGFSARRKLVLAVFLRMAFAFARPEVAKVREELLAGHTLASWAHDYPDEGPASKHFYESLHNMLRAKPAEVLVHTNLELYRQLIEQKDASGKPRHPNAGKVAIVDGCLIPANVPQRSPRDEEHRGILYGPGRERVEDVVYTDSNGRLQRFVAGYKLMTLVDMATNQAMVFCVCPADCSERQAALHLLRLLFRLWPECPLEILVGDGLYHNDVDFLRELIFELGVQPCFPDSNGKYRAGLEHVSTKGVPECDCGELMKLKDVDPLLTARSRAKKGIARGEKAATGARLRWVCEHGLCKPTYTRPFDDPRLYTFLPRVGDHPRAALRSALLHRRNAVESYFARLHNLGLNGKANRPAWAKDHEMDWLLGAGIISLTARRLVHEIGLYDLAEAEARDLRLLDQPSAEVPAPGPNEIELAGARRERERILGPAEPPRTWGRAETISEAVEELAA
jgi:DDE family transposase